MNWILIVLFVLWIYTITVLKRAKLEFWYFCVGSVGMFFFLLAWIQPFVIGPLTQYAAYVTGVAGKLTKMFEAYYQYGIIFIRRGSESISLYIDYECSGIIEIFAFLSLLWFFPVYRFYEKTLISIFGSITIFLGNIIRIMVICFCIELKGNDIFFLAHTVYGRIVFYTISIILYFYVFTRSHIIRQKVGSFKYEAH